MRRLTLVAVVLAAVVAVLAWVAMRETPVTVEIAAVARGPMQVTVDVDGKTRIREIYEVSAPLDGMALRSPVRVGDPVVEGETVVAVVRPVAPSLLDARSRIQAEAAVREAEAALQVAESQLREATDDFQYADSQLTRMRTLVERGVASLTRLEDAEQLRSVKKSALDAALSGRAMAASGVERARAALIEPGSSERPLSADCCVELKAPVTGRVLAIDAVSARPVTAGTRLVTLGAPGDLEIVADPLSRDAVTVPTGATAIVERWGGTPPLEAKLRQIEPSAHTEVSTLGIEEQRVEALFDFVSPPEAREGLGDGYAVYLRIVTWEGADVLTVPLGALFRDSDAWAVFRATGGRAEMVHVEIGRRNTAVAEVVSGLSEGDMVVTHPSDAVAEGVALEPVARQ